MILYKKKKKITLVCAFHYFERGFPLQTKWSLKWLLKEWISTPTHLESSAALAIFDFCLLLLT